MDSLNIGSSGENIAVSFLLKKGHEIINRNYRMKFGEIDIVSRAGELLYFIEVKAIAVGEDGTRADYRVEERVDRSKIKKLSHVIEHYLLHECKGIDYEWEFWVITVKIDRSTKRAYVKIIPETLSW